MKAISRALVYVGIFVLLTAWSTAAQEVPSQDTDLIRAKIEQFEKTEISSKSSTVQSIYQRTLLRLYNQFTAALLQDIADLKAMQAAVSGANPESQNEIAFQIEKLRREQNEALEKIQTLKGDLQTVAAFEANKAKAVAAFPESDAKNVTFERPRSSVGLANRQATPVSSISAITNTDSIAANSPPALGVAEDPHTTTKVTVCGQIRPASLTQTFALISSASTGLEATQILASTKAVKNSRYKDDCTENTDKIENLKNPAVQEKILNDEEIQKRILSGIPSGLLDSEKVALQNGTQKEAVVITLQRLLKDLESNEVRTDLGPGLSSLSRDTIRKQILILNEYIGNVKVQIKDDKGVIVATPLTDKDGNYTVQLAADKLYFFSTEADSNNTVRDIKILPGAGRVRVNLFIEDKPVSLLTRAVVGYEQAGAAAAKKNQDYFFDLFISSTFPFKQKIDPDFGERFRTWISLRFASVPQSGEATLGALSSEFATQVARLKVKDVANVFDFLGGFEYRLLGNDALLPSFDRRTKQKFSLSLIAGGGVITPTNPLDSITTFRVSPGAPGLPAEAVGKEFLAFVQSDRDRFFRQYYAGFRIQTFFFNLFNMPMQRFPAQLDLTIGQNEFVTGGKLHGPVFRVEGYYPLPYENLKFINIFGTAVLRPGRPKIGIPLVLQPAPASTTVPGSNVALIALPQPNRDYYRAGVGLDFISFVQKLRDAASKK